MQSKPHTHTHSKVAVLNPKTQEEEEQSGDSLAAGIHWQQLSATWGEWELQFSLRNLSSLQIVNCNGSLRHRPAACSAILAPNSACCHNNNNKIIIKSRLLGASGCPPLLCRLWPKMCMPAQILQWHDQDGSKGSWWEGERFMASRLCAAASEQVRFMYCLAKLSKFG